MNNFWDFSVWGWLNVMAVLFLSLLAANAMKKKIKILEQSLIPTSVLGGAILLVIASFYKMITGHVLFEEVFFGANGYNNLEIVTYHALALGFVASSFKTENGKLSKKRTTEIFNTGVTTVSTYLLQAIVGFGITIIASFIIKGFFQAAGVLLPFGYGQGTGQAMNYGTIYETEHGFVGGKTFGLTIAALGFLSASIGGVVHLNLLKRKRKIAGASEEGALKSEQVQKADEIPMQGSIDKMTIQIALVMVAYMCTFLLMFVLGNILPGMKSVIYGFNFLLGVLTGTLLKIIINQLKKHGIAEKEYINDFLMTRITAIRLDILENYWGIILILGVVGLFITYFYNHYVAKTLFPEYTEEQFLMMYGMLTGTASTGIILLREIDGDFKTPAADNMVYQNFPAIVFGFPMMLLATLAPVKPYLTMIILVVFFVGMNVLLFRSKIFKKRA